MIELITLPRATVQQALETLKCLVEAYEMDNTIRADIMDAEEAITALRAALEQPEQEEYTLVAWFNGKPVYSAPPRREWRSLSEEEILPLYSMLPSSHAEMLEFARAVEAALRSKNHG
jgi:hypothetical protein